jgi:hypothetical protein
MVGRVVMGGGSRVGIEEAAAEMLGLVLGTCLAIGTFVRLQIDWIADRHSRSERTVAAMMSVARECFLNLQEAGPH